VTFDGVAYIRIGENKKKLADFKEHERALWLATGRRRFEQAIAMSNASLREHFSLPQDEYQAVSTIITSMVREAHPSRRLRTREGSRQIHTLLGAVERAP
jgi:hypothetical protein